MDKDVFNYEPKLALNGGLDGFSMIRKVIDKIVLIKKKGNFFLEIGFNQKNKVKEMMKAGKVLIVIIKIMVTITDV